MSKRQRHGAGQFTSTIFVSAFGLMLTVFLSGVLIAQDSVKGSLTVDGTTAEIKHAYFDSYEEEFTIILTDNPVAPEMIPDGISTLSEEGKIKALEFTVTRETKQLLPRMRRAIYFHPVWTRNIEIGDAELTITKFNQEMLVGTIKTEGDIESDGHTVSYDISFSMSLKREPLKLTFTGKNDAPSKAYSAYCEAVMAGNISEFKKFVPTEKREMMPEDEQELVLGLEFVQETMMTNIEILSSKITGEKAVLTMKGSRGVTTADGTVTMVLEDGAWKVSEESWQLSTADK